MGLLKSIKKAGHGISSVGSKVLQATGKVAKVTSTTLIKTTIKSNPLTATAYKLGKDKFDKKDDKKKNIKTQQPIGLKVTGTGEVIKVSGSQGNDTDVSSVIENIEKRKSFIESLFDLF